MIEAAETIERGEPSGKLELTEKEARRFWAKVDKNGPEHPYDSTKGKCWDWTGWRQSKTGHGYFKALGKDRRAHRVSFSLANNHLSDDLQVQHTCNRSRCVNPLHLTLGTPKENFAYMILTGRSNFAAGDRHYSRRNPQAVLRGSRNKNSKLTESLVASIRKIGRSRSQQSIANDIGVSRELVGLVLRRKIWKHVP